MEVQSSFLFANESERMIYRVFISSTFQDLQKDRKAVYEQVLRAGHVPAGMELFSAGIEQELAVIKRAIDSSDVIVLLIGSRYGSVTKDPVTGATKSFTEIEFDYAVSRNKPILLFMNSQEDFEKDRRTLSRDHAERGAEVAIRAFRDSASHIDTDRSRIVAFYNTTAQLQVGLQTALNALQSRNLVIGGLVPYEPDVMKLGPIFKNPFLVRAISLLRSYEPLTIRCASAVDLKQSQARFFWDKSVAAIVHGGFFDLFFESGSTVAYVWAELANRLQAEAWGRSCASRWNITTNSVIVYLDLLLSQAVRGTLVPHGPPDLVAGATLGDLAELPAYLPPGPATMNQPVCERVRRTAEMLGRSVTNGLMLATGSGLLLTHDEAAGPFVRNYHNSLFKRAMLQAARPIVYFFHDQKVGKSFDNGTGFPICDRSLTWKEACVSLPIAVCVGAESAERRDEFASHFDSFGFKKIDYGDPMHYECFPLIAQSEQFQRSVTL